LGRNEDISPNSTFFKGGCDHEWGYWHYWGVADLRWGMEAFNVEMINFYGGNHSS